MNELNSVFDKIDQEILPIESARVDTIDNNLDTFVRETVPSAIERQSGEVSRQLRRAYETFDIEKKKELKRSEILLLRFVCLPLCQISPFYWSIISIELEYVFGKDAVQVLNYFHVYTPTWSSTEKQSWWIRQTGISRIQRNASTTKAP